MGERKGIYTRAQHLLPGHELELRQALAATLATTLPLLVRRLISQDAPSLSLAPPPPFEKFAATLINQMRDALARVGATVNRSRLKVPHRCKQTASLREEAEWLQNARASEREGSTM